MRIERIPGGVAFYESPEERDERIRVAAEKARRRLHLTPGMIKTLKRAQRSETGRSE